MKTSEDVRAYLDRQIAANTFPGIQYAVIGPKGELFSYVGGFADIAAQRPMQPDTTMMAYSMTKTLTAAAVLQLVEQGKVALHDPVDKHIEGLPYGPAMEVRHLLAQTSGLPDPIPLKWVHLAEDHRGFDEDATLRAIVARYPRLEFAPGKKYRYSNISYWLLGKVIAKASGMSYGAYMRQNVFGRLGISEREIDEVIPSPAVHAKGYLRKWSFLDLFKSFFIDAPFLGTYEGRWLHIKNHYLNGPAFGGIVTTVRAMGVFLQDQLQEESRLFSKRTKDLFYEQQKSTDGTPVEMTLGWHMDKPGGVRAFFKEGGGGGFHCEMRMYPDKAIASIAIANDTAFPARTFLTRVDRPFLGA